MSEEAQGESWPPKIRRPLTIDEYGYVTLREEADRMELTTPKGRWPIWITIAVVYDLLVLVLPTILVYHYWHTLNPWYILPRMGRAVGGFEWFVIKCVGGACLIHIIVFIKMRIDRVRQRLILLPKAGTYIDGLGRKRPLNSIVEAAVKRTGPVFVVRLAPVNDLWFGAGAMAPVWWFGSKESALEMTRRIADFAGIPIRAAVD